MNPDLNEKLKQYQRNCYASKSEQTLKFGNVVINKK